MSKSVNDKSARRSRVKYAFLDATDSGDTELVAAVTGKKIRVLRCIFIATTAVTAKLRSATTPITAGFPLGATAGFVMSSDDSYGWCETVAGQALNVNLGAAVATGVNVVYEEV